LVETVLERHDGRPGVCLDLGTGTGAIALALKSERPAWTVTGIDSVAAAVELAIANARQLSLDVAFITGNWCDSIQEKSLDIIVSNPPYIDAEDTHLKEGDVRFEPLSALVSGQKGYQDISLIVAQAVVCLKPGGSVYFEHGWQQAQGVRAILIANGFVDVETRKDYGGNDRVTFGRLKTEQG
jgi:release factor glutamine methyltransferase